MNIKKLSAIPICFILATQTLPVYAEETGSIQVNADIETNNFKGEIYVILSDENNSQKLALLNENNGYKTNLDNLSFTKYEVKEIHVFNGNEYDKERKELSSEYTIDYGNLNLNAENKTSDVIIKIHSIDTQLEDEKSNKEESSGSGNIDILKQDDNNKNEQKKVDTNNSDNNEENKSLERKKNYIFFNFIIDVVLITGLGAIWFFKIRKRKDKE